jgi:DNA-directed RNA polymerase specialized sigma24 family protein
MQLPHERIERGYEALLAALASLSWPRAAAESWLRAGGQRACVWRRRLAGRRSGGVIRTRSGDARTPGSKAPSAREDLDNLPEPPERDALRGR